MSTHNKYVKGAAALAATHRRPLHHKKREHVVGYDWWKVLYNPAGLAYDYYNNPVSQNYSPGGAQNIYWGQQRAASLQNPLATYQTQRLQTAQQLQQTLRAQQAANMAALQRQLAAMTPAAAPMPTPTYAPPSPGDQGISPTPDSGDGGAPDAVVGASGQEQYVVIKIRNMGDVIQKQGAQAGYGNITNILYAGAPSTLNAYALNKMQSELKQKLAEKGVDAEVTLASSAPSGPEPRAEFVRGAVAGVVGAGALYGLYRLAHALLHRRG